MKMSCLDDTNHQHVPLQHKSLQELKPFLDANGVACGRGRLRNSSINWMHTPYVMIISCKFARDYHNIMAHGGRSATMQEIRRSGYWIINCNTLVWHTIFNCIRKVSKHESKTWWTDNGWLS